MTVRRSLLLALGAAMVPLVALGWVAYLLVRDDSDDAARREAERTAQLGAGVVHQRLGTAQGELAGIAEWPDLISPALGVARGGGEDQRAAAGAALAAATTWWPTFEELTVMSGTAPVVTTSAQAANRIPDALLGAAAVGPVAGGWDAERSTFMVARPLTGADGDAVIVAELSTSFVTDALVGFGGDAQIVVGLPASDSTGGPLSTSPRGDVATVDIQGTAWSVRAPVADGVGIAGNIVLATIVALIALIAISTAIILVVGRSISRRIQRLTDTAEAIGAGRLDQRTGLAGRDEIAVAAGSFDRMAEQLTTDISRRKEMETLLVQQALHDPLTGLANRAKLIDRLGDALVRSTRSERPVGLLFCDLDGFKAINDQLGHSAGDDLLMLVADRFRTSVRPSDTVARFGGDEFVVLCSDLREPADVVAVADRLRLAFEEPFQLGGTEVSTTASVGIAVGIGGSSAPDEMLRRADQAMYQAKAAGKARHVVYELTVDEEERTRSERAREVQAALEHDQLTLEYQPVIDLDAGGIVGHEAYVRWHHPERGDIRPQELIDLATSAGLASAIDLWVLDLALRELAPWRCAAGGATWTSVNLTPGSLATPGFAVQVGEVLARRDSSPSSIVLEVSEASLSGEPGTVLSTLDELHDLGVGLAIDDFGTGHSSLDRLRRCPIDSIKIHQTLVHGVVSDDDDRAAVQAIVSMADALDLSVVAEGIETPEQATALRQLGCQLGQGYHLANPVPVRELAAPDRPGG